MAYLFKQKLKLDDLVDMPKAHNRVLIFEPNDYLGALYSYYLNLHSFEVRHCAELGLLKESLSAFGPGLLVFSADALRPERLLKNFADSFPGLKIVTTAYNLPQDGVSALLAAGVLSHINRRFSRPQDLVILAKTFSQSNF